MSNTPIATVSVTGPELWEIVAKMADAVKGHGPSEVMLAACSFATVLQNPYCTPDQLRECTQKASNAIALYFSPPPETVN